MIKAKEILKEFEAPVSSGVVIFSLEELDEKIKQLKSKEFVVKAQIHAGGRGKGGGVKLVKNIEELNKPFKEAFQFVSYLSGYVVTYFFYCSVSLKVTSRYI